MLALASALYSYSALDSWYHEVRAVKALSVSLESWSVEAGERPTVRVRVRLSNPERPVKVNYIDVSVYRGSEPVREKSENFPSGLALQGNYTVLEELTLPSTVDPRCLGSGECSFHVVVGVHTRFGVVPLAFTLKP